jgi:hypothetical protein
VPVDEFASSAPVRSEFASDCVTGLRCTRPSGRGRVAYRSARRLSSGAAQTREQFEEVFDLNDAPIPPLGHLCFQRLTDFREPLLVQQHS